MATTKLRSVLIFASGCYLAIAVGCASREPFRLDSAFGQKSGPNVKDPKLAKAIEAIEHAKRNAKPSSDQFAIDTSRRTNEMIKKAQEARGKTSDSFGAKLKSAAGSTASYVGGAFRMNPSPLVGSNPDDAISLSHDPGPLNADLYVKTAAHYEAQGNATAAYEQYQKALTTDAAYKPALVGLGRLLHRQGQMQESIQTYQRALSAYPRDPVLLNDLALCYAREKDYDQAIASLNLAKQVSPNSLLYRNNLAAILVEAGRADEAVGVLAEVNGPAIANYNVGYLLNQRSHVEQAHEYFLRALSYDPNMSQAQTMLTKTAPVGPYQQQSSPQMHATRPARNDFGSTLPPIVLPHQVPEYESRTNQIQPSEARPIDFEHAPFNYQTAAKSFQRMEGPKENVTGSPFSPYANDPMAADNAPQLLAAIEANAMASDPMQEVLDSMQTADATVVDSNVSAASYVVSNLPADEEATQTDASIRMPTFNSRTRGTLVPPTPVEF
ncbi:MAG: tetratricopeptide repeat protein [Planctomycetales bacterium]|nr:tetratricopeptide repeat protein [Planctomycetales bacterium]